MDLRQFGKVQTDGSVILSRSERLQREYKRIPQSKDVKRFLVKNKLDPVFSSVISAIGTKGNDLYVRFHNASVYVYYGQSTKFTNFIQSASKGQFFNFSVRPTKRYKKLESLYIPDDYIVDKKFKIEQDIAQKNAILDKAKPIETNVITNIYNSNGELVNNMLSKRYIKNLPSTQLSDNELFDRLDTLYLQDLTKGLNGKRMSVDKVLVKGIPYNKVTIDDLILYLGINDQLSL